jgi:hypothetical protein
VVNQRYVVSILGLLKHLRALLLTSSMAVGICGNENGVRKSLLQADGAVAAYLAGGRSTAE